MLRNHELRGFLAYLSAAAMWAVNGSVSKALLDTGMPAARLSQFRATAAWLILFVIIAATKRTALRIRSRQELAILAVYGLAGITMTQFLYFVAIHLMPVGVALVLEFTAPLMVALWVRLAWKRHVGRGAWLGLGVALAGLTMITEVWNGFVLDPLGVISALGAAAALAAYFLAGERALRLPNPRDPLSMTMFGFGFAAGFWALVCPWWEFPWEYFQGSASFMNLASPIPRTALALSMVVFGTVLPFWLTLVAIKYLSAQQASAAGMTEPVLASVVAWLVLGEVLSPWQLAGCVVTLTGIGLAEFSRR